MDFAQRIVKMIRYLTHIKDVAQKKTTWKKVRSSKWRSVRKLHLKKYPRCRICESKRNIQVHHIKPISLFPELELSLKNLTTLCSHCHLVIGHLRDYRTYNRFFIADVRYIRRRIKEEKKPSPLRR